ncbi:hypothetical protein PHYBLDRAFT_132343 [Phycomyces blakesleeanus NRRL 1555(-)]|uniref:Maintenance of telomere capping protein 1 n=1 Tax=Phycomyces blakesleeanus (strain ATCC 8743b / DSM 1359 / FGSC 10004 / NBRC 33097 / NRRL 1555) TaxID=763407 RepID=A0A167NN17_PHYB8|nr:hypothetical protein PHYBLDRAFT_132343 [Phycomyces blakesleeanus NRRL 1555(-)]OAD76314.1 hypothetical protein PHYBLDRAFT_132343 [Phycomyces blakesleeanus NRRL 1555(-)]|eukprot:XP_018294354.1 hypothetical protein PHYBLDRAFT_132343 [Phycomyces blakesleeanus NRRL 1555(-)]
MSFLDEIAKYPSESSTIPQKEYAKSSSDATQNSQISITEPASAPTPVSDKQVPTDGWMSWGNSLWTQASAAVKTTTEQINQTIANESAAKLLEDRMKHLQGLVNKENIEKLGTGLRNLTVQSMNTFLETVAPPISEHELVEVWLSHDMNGYEGMESLVYRSFARVMENTETGQVVVRKGGNKGESNKSTGNVANDLNMCEGALEGTKLAKANIDNLIKLHYTAPEEKTDYIPQQGAVPVINCPVFMAIQPVKHSVPLFDEDDTEKQQLVYVLLLVDPTHNLKFKTYSQSIPLSWLEIAYEENEWVEEKLTEVVQAAVITLAQDYVWTRMTGGKSSATGASDQTEEKAKVEHTLDV